MCPSAPSVNPNFKPAFPQATSGCNLALGISRHRAKLAPTCALLTTPVQSSCCFLFKTLHDQPWPFKSDFETLEVKTTGRKKNHPWIRLLGTSSVGAGEPGDPQGKETLHVTGCAAAAWMTWSCEPLSGKCLGDPPGGGCGRRWWC